MTEDSNTDTAPGWTGPVDDLIESAWTSPLDDYATPEQVASADEPKRRVRGGWDGDVEITEETEPPSELDSVLRHIFPDPNQEAPPLDELAADVTVERRAARMLAPGKGPNVDSLLAVVGVSVDAAGRLLVAWDHRPSPADEAALARAVGMPVESRRVSPSRFAELRTEAENLLIAGSDSPEIERFIDAALDQGASDLHLRVGASPWYRVAGVLAVIPDTPILSVADMESIAAYVMGRVPEPDMRDHDCAMTYRGVRFRVNVFRQRAGYGVVLRIIPTTTPVIASLGLPKLIDDLTERRSGIIIVSGVTGSGKSTTLAAMVDAINTSRRENIITLEDPIEYVHTNKMSLVSQREIGQDTDSYSHGLRACLREDPDVILVGEMRDFETIEAAVRAAETGHLVLSTLHAGTAQQAIDRIIDVYPPSQQGQIRVQLAATLIGVICQKLVPASQPGQRRVATEIMVVNEANRSSILNPENNTIAQQLSARVEGQHFMEHSLAELVASGDVEFDDAKRFANRPQIFTTEVQVAKDRRDGRI